ncbi:MAG: ABC transporter permease [Ignavibacteria bacterium]|nr:ABC transporter permease [Ignavibacteria bacterium]
MRRLIKYVWMDILRNRIVVAYTIFLLVISFSLFNLDENVSKGIVSLLNIILLIVPLISVIFCTIYYYNSSEFIELMLSQPVRRSTILFSIYLGLSFAFLIAITIGIGIPVFIYSPNATGLTLYLIACALSLCFNAIACLASVYTNDKARGIGVSILLWFYFAIIYDGLVLFILFSFNDYPMEKITIVLSTLNPVDLGRILILLQLDSAALMGYTGAVFEEFFGSYFGLILSAMILCLWIVIPVLLALRKFVRKDL